MTRCYHGGHDFPYEDESGAHCEEHGVTLLWHGPPVAEDEPARVRASRLPPDAAARPDPAAARDSGTPLVGAP